MRRKPGLVVEEMWEGTQPQTSAAARWAWMDYIPSSSLPHWSTEWDACSRGTNYNGSEFGSELCQRTCDLGTLLTRTGPHVLLKLSDEDTHIHLYNVPWLPIGLRSRGAWHVDRAYLVFKECLSILPFLRENVLSLVQLLTFSTNIYWVTLGCQTLC